MQEEAERALGCHRTLEGRRRREIHYTSEPLMERVSGTSGDAPPGLLRALADPRLALAIRQMHNHIARSWTVAALAKASASSRSAFFERFTRIVGVPPMDYLLR
jgi:transcriptional regulator GlxA family with amidase domain